MDLNQLHNPFENRDIIAALSTRIQHIANDLDDIRIMHVCGTHEHEIVHFGIRQLLPESIQIIPGPGCPVCVCPVELIDRAVSLSHQPDVTVLTFGDMLRVPASRESLDDARKNGGSVRMIYGPLEAIDLAKKQPDRNFVLFSIGFETTVAGVAGMIQSGIPENLYLLMANRYIPPVLRLLTQAQRKNSIQGFLLPGHAVAITGTAVYDFLETDKGVPSVVAGFTPVDILAAIFDLLQAIQRGGSSVINAYKRVVRDEGNRVAQAAMGDVFNLVPGNWRGIGMVKNSAYDLAAHYQHLDASRRFECDPIDPSRQIVSGCRCDKVMLGEISPRHCGLFGDPCSPDDPQGPCMVSMEGTCYNWYHSRHPD